MANEQSGAPLRRWRPFFGAFVAIDDAIEAAGHPRAEFQEMRVRILKLLRAATDDGVAEQLCAALDDAMAESLQTLRVAPVPHTALASTDLARAVGNLRNHGSARIRRLAGDVVRGWTAAVDGAVKEELHKFSGDSRIPRLPAAAAEEHKNLLRPTATAVVTQLQNRPMVAQSEKMIAKKPVVAQSEKMEAKKPVVVQNEKMEAKNLLIVARSKKMEPKKPVMAQSEKMEANKPVMAQSEKMEATKRKLREGYQEAEKLKRQHTIKKINDKEAPKLLERSRQQKMRQCGPARCRTSSVVRRSLLPSLQQI